MTQRRRSVRRAVLLAAVLAAAGCGGGEPEIPEGAVRLVANQPTSWEGLRLVAGNIWDDTAVLTAFDEDGVAESADLAPGERVTVMGHSFEVVSVHEDTGDAPPGGSRSHVWVLPVG